MDAGMDLFGHGGTWGRQLIQRYDGISRLPFEKRQKPRPDKKISKNYRPCVRNLARAIKDIAESLRSLDIADVSERTMQRVLKDVNIRKTNAVKDALLQFVRRSDWTAARR